MYQDISISPLLISSIAPGIIEDMKIIPHIDKLTRGHQAILAFMESKRRLADTHDEIQLFQYNYNGVTQSTK